MDSFEEIVLWGADDDVQVRIKCIEAKARKFLKHRIDVIRGLMHCYPKNASGKFSNLKCQPFVSCSNI